MVFIQLLNRRFYELTFAAFKCSLFFGFFLKNVCFGFQCTLFTGVNIRLILFAWQGVGQYASFLLIISLSPVALFQQARLLHCQH